MPMIPFSAHRVTTSRILTLLFLVIGHILITACAGSTPTIPANSPVTSWQAGRVIDVKTGRSIDLPTFLVTLTRFDVVYLGEEHYNQHHIDAALTVLQTVLANDRRPVLTMEMFGWDGQPALDKYLATPGQDRQTFLDQSRWKQNWGGAFDNYEPLVNFSREHRIMLRAMNPPKPLIRQVVKAGLDEARKG